MRFDYHFTELQTRFLRSHFRASRFRASRSWTLARPNAPARNFTIELDQETLEYGPVAGIKPLREKIANYYNKLYKPNETDPAKLYT